MEWTADTRINPVILVLQLQPDFGLDMGFIEQYRQTVMAAQPQLSDKVVEHRLQAAEPRWLAQMQQAIRASIAPTEQDANGDGRFLSQAVANAATDFFQNTADLLPNEPSIYSSRQGDLVAEFKGKRGNLTAIVASTFVVLFAVIDGEPFQRRVSDSQHLRQDVRQFIDALRSGRNEALESAQ